MPIRRVYANLVKETFHEFTEDRGFIVEDVDWSLYSQLMKAFHRKLGGYVGAFSGNRQRWLSAGAAPARGIVGSGADTKV